MGKVKVVSKNNQVSVKVKSTKDEQLNFVIKLIDDLLLTRDEFKQPLAKH